MKCIIFDCDGVLVDSEMIASQHFIKHLADAGYPIPIETSIKRFTGKASKAVWAEINAEAKNPFSTAQMQHIQKAVHAALHLEVSAIAGMAEILQDLQKNNVKFCLASSGNLEKINNSLRKTGLDKYFSSAVIFSVDHVKVGKPAPDLFLYAAKNMGFEPQDCIVIEDSIAGIEAAIAANMPVIGFLGGSHTRYDWYKERMAVYGIPIVRDSEELAGILM